MSGIVLALMAVLCGGSVLHGSAAHAEAVSFELDVMPILSKAGCYSGGCHGALAGKGGFRLSLFGYDPASDHVALTRDARGRRVDLADPGASLLLTKPTTAVASSQWNARVGRSQTRTGGCSTSLVIEETSSVAQADNDSRSRRPGPGKGKGNRNKPASRP